MKRHVFSAAMVALLVAGCGEAPKPAATSKPSPPQPAPEVTKPLESAPGAVDEPKIPPPLAETPTPWPQAEAKPKEPSQPAEPAAAPEPSTARAVGNAVLRAFGLPTP